MKETDHREINKKLDLYHIENDSPGMIFWHNNGLIIINELIKLIRNKLNLYNYQEVQTPTVLNFKLWKKTKHWKYYKNNIFTTYIENKKYCLKPMNCPAHICIFNNKIRSYKDLPFRISEFGNCHRKELSGSIHGLMRNRSFTQDDAHIFCTEDQINDEIINCINMINDIYKIFLFKNIEIKFSTRPKNSIGENKIWQKAEKIILNILNNNNITFSSKIGDGAFYGPKIEFLFTDSLNRIWQCGTIQLDFYLSKKLNSFYICKNNVKKNPILIHRAILGSIERFIGIITEEYSGCYPTWLSPIQLIIISITKKHIKYVINVTKKLIENGFRVKYDIRNEKLDLKIREYTLLKIPYIIICGDKEVESNKVSVRMRNGINLKLLNINLLIKNINNEINNRNYYQWGK